MPDRHHNHREHRSHRSRSRSPSSRHRRSHRERSPHRSRRDASNVKLPFDTRQLTKYDFKAFKPLFASYLDVQKGKDLDEMDEYEAKGRWKSFIGKWNRGELAEGWYDPRMLQRAQEISGADDSVNQSESRGDTGAVKASVPNSDSDSDESIGPTLPGAELRSRSSRKGPTVPSMTDLQLKREIDVEDASARREDLRYARKLDRKEQKERLDELVPRAEAGTRERQLEKKKEINEKMKSFRERSPGAAEVPESDLMGDGDGIESYKKLKQEAERKKNERELRREEVLRARAAEREEKMAEHREREDKTMAMLKALAKQNFG